MRRATLPDTADSPTPQGTLRALSVSRSFEGVQALDDVTLELHRHEVVGLIGPNGAGKSTLVNLMTGFDFPTSGSDRARRARDHELEPAPARARRARAHVPALQVVPRPDGARERRGRRARRRRRAARGAQARRRAAAAARPRRRASTLRAGSLAHGDERRLGVARALAMEPTLRADGRAGGRAARGRGARVRGRRARGARRSRRGRAPDRPQHGADHGRLRPHPRARPGRDAGRGRAATRSARTSTSPPPTSARAPCARTTHDGRDARDRRPRRQLRRRRRRARPLDRGRQGRDRGPDRPERRGQVDDAARDHGPRATRARRDPARGRVAARPLARGRSRARASRSCPRGGASSPT